MVVGRDRSDLGVRHGDLGVERGELQMLLVLLRAVVAPREREDQRVVALQLAEPARRVRVIGQLVIGKRGSGHHVRSHSGLLAVQLLVCGQSCRFSGTGAAPPGRCSPRWHDLRRGIRRELAASWQIFCERLAMGSAGRVRTRGGDRGYSLRINRVPISRAPTVECDSATRSPSPVAHTEALPVVHGSLPNPYTGSSVPACSATMYAAYQVGQSASRSPVRFSCSPWAASARRIALARSLAEPNAVSVASTRPGSRVVISCSSQLLPSGSLKVAKEP